MKICNVKLKNDQTLIVDANPQDLFDQSLLLDMLVLGTHQLCGGVNIFFFYKVSFEKHPSVHSFVTFPNSAINPDIARKKRGSVSCQAFVVDLIKRVLKGLPNRATSPDVAYKKVGAGGLTQVKIFLLSPKIHNSPSIIQH